jgi:hypothetical protein
VAELTNRDEAKDALQGAAVPPMDPLEGVPTLAPAAGPTFGSAKAPTVQLGEASPHSAPVAGEGFDLGGRKMR